MAKLVMNVLLCIGIALPVVTGGCENDKQTGALIGGAAGAGIGQAVGRNTEGTLIGAAVGAGAGYLIGAQSDKKKEQQQAQTLPPPEPASPESKTVWITNSNGSQTPVTLVKEGTRWRGPKGEYYAEWPTEEQLREVYGL